MAATAQEKKPNEKKPTESDRDPAKEMLLRNTTGVLRTFMECSDQIQEGILEMVAILDDENADPDEKAAAAVTLIESLYPKYVGEELGIDSEKYELLQRTRDEPELEDELDKEEATFAKNLANLMDEKGVTQKQLAEQIGVGQPAVSMMLSRTCRPQRRTIEKIAEALGVTVKSLWPYD